MKFPTRNQVSPALLLGSRCSSFPLEFVFPSETARAVSPTPTIVPESTPVFRAHVLDEDVNNVELENSMSDDDTKKSFDFTGELRKLNESGASDRMSFMEQLESAFKTPARVKYDFSKALDLPPVPPIPSFQCSTSTMVTTEEDAASDGETQAYRESRLSDDEGYCGRVDVSQMEQDESPPPQLNRISSRDSKPSDGQLNTSFKFGGGTPSALEPNYPDVPTSCRPRTLSDIIPPPSHHSRSNSDSSYIEEDSSVLKSIFAHITSSVLPHASDVAVPRPRARFDSDVSSRRYSRRSRNMNASRGPNREDSRVSFLGFDSFDEVRRGFEFGQDRPAFYPPPNTSRSHNKHDSMFSITSISSYGSVIDSGNQDPFGYSNDQSRPSSDDMSFSMSMSVDDTFSFMQKGQNRRTRVDSDASSFYFKAPPPMMGPIRRGHRARDSMISVTSNAPPVSLYNRSHVGHRRADSSTSVSSMAYSYAMQGASGGRAAWARHSRGEPSRDSIMSDYSMNFGRPGLGDKMLESAFDHGMPLSSISASPSHSVDERFDFATYDSIMDTRRSITREDSIFDATGARDSTSSSSDSDVFDDSHRVPRHHVPPRRFRPVSVLSTGSVHSSRREDDTMISVSYFFVISH